MTRAVPSDDIDECTDEAAAVPLPRSLQRWHLFFPLLLDDVEAQTRAEECVVREPTDHVNVAVVEIA